MALLRTLSGNDGQGNENAALRTAFLAAMEPECPILNYAQFYSITGNADTIQSANELTGAGEQRAVNADFSTRAQSTSNEITATLRISGDEIETDRALERRGLDIAGLRLRDLKTYARSFGRYVMDQFVNGTGTGQNVSGFATLVDASQQFILGGGTDGQVVALGNSDANKVLQQEFLADLDALIESVIGGAEFLLMDAQLVARLKAIAREYVTVSNVQDAFGRTQQITEYNGVPIIRSGFASDGTTKVIPFSETVGATANCGSIYAGRFGEQTDITCPTNVGLVLKDHGLDGSHYLTSFEMDWNVALQNVKALSELRGIALA